MPPSNPFFKAIRYVRIHGRLPTWENFKRRHRPAMPPPPRLQIEPTTLCNLCCATCPHKNLPESRRGKSMPFELFRRIVEQVPGVRDIKLQGLGEPLLAPELPAMLRWGRERGLRFDVISNGHLPFDRYPPILPFFSRLAVSLDAVTSETAKKLRLNIDVERVKDCVRRMAGEKKRVGWPCIFGINCVVSSVNAHEIPAIMRFAAEAGVDAANFVLVENWKMPGETDYEESRAFVRESLARVGIDSVRKAYDEGGYRFQLGLQDAAPRKGQCYWCFSSVFITCDGYVTPCCLRPNPEMMQFGCLKETSFRDVWNGQKMQEFRLSHLRNLPNPVCDFCPR